MAKLVATRPFRFGVVSSDAATAEEWTAKARRAEELGYDVFLVPDHLSGMLSTVPALAAAAAATSKIRIGSFVFDTRLRDPAVLTHEVATLDLLSEGRFEVGLGAGHMRSEYESAGIGFTSPGDRLAQLEQAVAIMKAVLGTNGPITVETSEREVRDFGDFPRGPQAPPPILIGGGSPKILPSIDEILSVQAVYGAPQEVIVAAKVHPAPGRTADELADALDDIDRALRQQLPEVAEVFIDLTSHRASPREGG